MKKIITISILTSALLLSSCGEQKSAQKPNAMPPSLVDVQKFESTDASVYYEFAGILKANKNIFIQPKVSAEITAKNFKDGQFVKKGSVLFELDKEQYKAQLDLSQADIAVARANFENAETEYKRSKDLYAKKAIAKKELDAKEAAYKSARAGLSKAAAAAKIAKLNYDYTSVRAPFDGFVQNALIDKGAFAVANNSKLVQLIDQDKMRAVFHISDSALAKIKANGNDLSDAKAVFTYNGKEYAGKLKFISNATELASIEAYAEFDNHDHSLNAGSFVQVRLVDIVQKDSFVIKKENLLQDINGYYVYIKDKNKAKQVYVDLSFDDEKIAVVKANGAKIKENDELILNNYKKIYPGASVATDAEFAMMMKQAAAAKQPEKAQK